MRLANTVGAGAVVRALLPLNSARNKGYGGRDDPRPDCKGVHIKIVKGGSSSTCKSVDKS